MRTIEPTPIAPEALTACNVPENDYPEWSGVASYVVGDRRLYEHKIYEALVANTNCVPTAYISTIPPKWLDCGFDNRWKMFDKKVGSQTSLAEEIELTLAPGLVDSIAFLDVDAVAIDIVMTDPVEGVVYSATVDLIDQAVIDDAYTYFFIPIVTHDAAVLLGIPPYGNASISFTIRNPGGVAKIGTLAVGMQKSLGIALYQPSVGITDYSRKEKDQFGEYSIIERGFSKRLSCDVRLKSSKADDLHRTLAEYRATPVIWVGVDVGYSSTIIYGFFNSFEITLSGANYSSCTLEIEGLS